MQFEIIAPEAHIYHTPNEQTGIQMLQDCEYFGRVSHWTEERQGPETYKRFIADVVMNKGDLSIIQHRSITVEALVDRGVADEWVRHRIGAYTMRSTRFVNYAKENTTGEIINPISFVCPREIREEPEIFATWLMLRRRNVQEYEEYLLRGRSPEIARNCLPLCLATKLICTYNLHMWRYFFLMRTTKNAHPQMREVTIPLLEEFKNFVPIIFDDIIPNSTQKHNLTLLH
jgi:thymidylate synthase (FAD)